MLTESVKKEFKKGSEGEALLSSTMFGPSAWVTSEEPHTVRTKTAGRGGCLYDGFLNPMPGAWTGMVEGPDQLGLSITGRTYGLTSTARHLRVVEAVHGS